jgi:dipeptidase D
MASALTNLKPELLWKHFDEIRKIPHCSKQEIPLGKYVVSIAEKNGLLTKNDKEGNIVIIKPSTQGHEKAETVVIQSHLDMVCEKNSDIEHDFSKDPLNVQIQDEWITACGTTLGADNGIGVAASLAVLEDNSLIHGPIELLFTIDEETGLNGASALQSDFLKGRILLNTDSEEEGTFFIGCAGGGDSEITLPAKRKTSFTGTTLKISLTGLHGGHSGIDINKGRGNALQIMARMLSNIDITYDLISIEGGSKHNAIPREAFTHLIITDNKEERLKTILQNRFEEIQFEYKATEKEMNLNIEPVITEKIIPISEDAKNKFLALLVAIPHGVLSMNHEIAGLVQTSNNLAIVHCDDEYIKIYTSSRSSITSALEATRFQIEAIARLAGAQIIHHTGYPPWTPNLDSKLLETMKKIYSKLTGEDPKVMAIHAGLECGIIGEKFPGMDMISFGPNLENPHSPAEKVHIHSVKRFWDLLTATLEALA